MFRSMFFGENPVSDLSLHVLRAPRSVLWVVGYGSSVTSIHPTCAWALVLNVMEYELAEAKSLVKN